MKIIRNIDGKKLELTLTNKEMERAFLNVFFDTDDADADGELFARGDGILAERCKREISSALECEGTRKPSDLVLRYLGKQAQETLNCEYEHLSDDIAERYTNILHWAERSNKKTVQAAFEEAKRRYYCEAHTYTHGGYPMQARDCNDELFAVVLEDILLHHPEIIGSKPEDAE